MNLTLVDIAVADLTDSTGGSTFVVDKWSGTGTITNDVPATKDTISATKAGGTFTLGDTELTPATTWISRWWTSPSPI